MRRWPLRLVSVVLAPLVFLVALEVLLRAVGYGRDTAFFVETADGAAWTTNPDFGYRFFDAGYQIRPEPLRAPRAADEIRIVVLGGSAAFGDLDFGYGFGRLLESMLRLRHRERGFRVISAALSGANSHVMRVVAGDAAVLRPDVFVVLLGNNEVVGPFGPGAFRADGSSPRAPPLWAVQAGLALADTRVGQLLGALLRFGLRPVDRPPPGVPRVLPTLRLDDERLAAAHAAFASNLDTILQRAADAGARALLCTVPVNLRDREPFQPLRARGLSDADTERMDELLREADFLFQQRQFQASLELYRQAARLDPGFATTQYRMGRALDALGEAEAADEALARARDLDGLRTRADSEINRIVRRSAGSQPSATLVDLERELAQRAPGRGLFYDHVHFTLRGNYEVARRVYAHLEPVLDLEPRTPPDFASVRAELPVTAWDRLLLSRRLANRPLLPGQQRRTAGSAPPRDTLLEAERRYARVLERRPDDLLVRDLQTELLLALGRGEAALEGADRLIAALPRVPRWQRLRGAALLLLDRPQQALAAFGTALDLDPLDFDARLARGRLRERVGDPSGAAADLEAARRIRPRDPELGGE